MGLKSIITKAGQKTADKISKLAALSPEQLEQVEKNREEYLSEMPNPNDDKAVELTNRLIASSAVEIYNAYLPQLSSLYVPLDSKTEYVGEFKPEFNIRYINITKWVTDKKENNLEKLVNVYDVLSNEECNISLIFNRKCEETKVYLAVTNTKNDDNLTDINIYKDRLMNAIRGNFPGAEWNENVCANKWKLPCFDDNIDYSIASATNIPTEKSEKFISQTIEKILDGTIPNDKSEEYTIILLATPIQNVEERKNRLSEIYSGLAPYSSWQTDYTYQESKSTNSSATVGVNVGASAGMQQGINEAKTLSESESNNENVTEQSSENKSEQVSESQGKQTSQNYSKTEGKQVSVSEGNSHSDGTNNNIGMEVGVNGSTNVGVDFIVKGNANVGANVGVNGSHGWNETDTVSHNITDGYNSGVTEGVGSAITSTAGKAVTSAVGKSISNSLGRAFTSGVSKTAGMFKGINLGMNFGANFARSSSVTATIGKNEGIHQTYTNYSIKHALEMLESQMKRYETSTALGMWDFAAYVISEDPNIANNVAHSYVALTQGEESYMSKSAVNLWRGDLGEDSNDAKEIYKYLRDLRHPIFAMNPYVLNYSNTYYVYPSAVSATTALTGKELAYSLNFPQRSISGLPVIECTEFGRNVVTYDDSYEDKYLNVGNIYHMHHIEKSKVGIAKQSLASHTFITGSTGSGKSNTTYKIIDECQKEGVKFLVIEPAKGEYKNVFGNREDVNVYGTNPELTPLLKINPFSFPSGIHVLEHLDRLVEILNVCWPMYAAMPAVLKNAIEKSYVDCGWDLTTSKNKYNENIYPTFKDVAINVKEIIDSSEYDNENKGAYKGSLLTRLQSLTNGLNRMIFTNDEIKAEWLFDENVIIDLSRVGSSETKTMIMGMLVLKLQEYRIASSKGINSMLKHITVLEEAHNLLKRTATDNNPESFNLIGKSVEMLSNSIAEMRTYGEGFVIVDQSPGLLDMSVIRNTNTKIIMRLPDMSDRELVGKAANLNPDQILELARLPRGVAAVYQNEWIQPVLCKVEKFKYPEELYEYSFDEDDLEYLEPDNNFIEEKFINLIMQEELLALGNKEHLNDLKDMILSSNFSNKFKCSYIEYLKSDKEQRNLKLQHMIYNFFDVDEIIRNIDACKDADEWMQLFMSKLSTKLNKYPKDNVELIVSLLLKEASDRNHVYDDVYRLFVNELNESEGIR